MTLWGEIFSTSAVSSTLRPAKNRNSITFAFRGSIWAMLVNASSKANQFTRAPSPHFRYVVEVKRYPRASPFRCDTRARPIRKDPPHDFRGDRKEVSPILPLHIVHVDEMQISLMHQCGRL